MSSRLVSCVAVLSLLALLVAERAAAGDAPDWSPIAQAIGANGELGKDGTYKVTILRSDVVVRNGLGFPMPAGLGLNSYAAFVGLPDKASVVGDTCLLEHEVNPAIDALRAGGVEVVAIHNHMLGDDPRLIFLHFEGHGDGVALARTIRRAWDELGKPKAAPLGVLGPAPTPDWNAVAGILGRPGSLAKDGTYKVTLPRADFSVALDGQALPAGVGLACWVAYWSCPCGRTMAMGDTCVSRGELQGCIDALRRGGIEITGIHNHLLGASSEVMFMHFSGEGDALALARTVRSAWDLLPVPKATPPPPAPTPPDSPRAWTFDFEATDVGLLPEGFSTGLTGGGGPVAWAVRTDAGAPSGSKVLAQTSADSTDYRFPVCVYDKAPLRDSAVEVRFKPVSGRVDQAGGLVVRYRDANNYYLARANALEDNVCFYRVVDGRRQQIASANVKVASGVWHGLKLVARGSEFEVFFDGQSVIRTTDSTFPGEGKAGVWSKADSVTYFDDFAIRPQ